MFECPYLGSGVELTDEREAHIVERHPDLPSDYAERITETLQAPDEVHTGRPATLVFSRWYDDLHQGKYLLVFVVTGDDDRNWIITSRLSRRRVPGAPLWQRS
jgi:hypothetical protein